MVLLHSQSLQYLQIQIIVSCSTSPPLRPDKHFGGGGSDRDPCSCAGGGRWCGDLTRNVHCRGRREYAFEMDCRPTCVSCPCPAEWPPIRGTGRGRRCSREVRGHVPSVQNHIVIQIQLNLKKALHFSRTKFQPLLLACIFSAMRSKPSSGEVWWAKRWLVTASVTAPSATEGF